MSDEQKDDVVTTLEIDTDTQEGMALLEAIGSEAGVDFSASALLGVPSDEQTFGDLDELEAFEDHENDGWWVNWPAVPGARVLLAHPENALIAWPQIEREVRAKYKVKEGDPTPLHLLQKATGLTAFGRSIKGWNLTKGGQPLEFNPVNFLARWRRRRFREFLTASWREFKRNPQALSEESGKD